MVRIVLLGRNRHWCADMGNLATDKTVHHFCFGLGTANRAAEAQETGHEVQLRIQDQQITLRIRVTATRDNQQLTLINPAPAATPRSETAADPRTPAEVPRSPEELTPRGIERWHEERWVQEAAEARMTMQELIRRHVGPPGLRVK